MMTLLEKFYFPGGQKEKSPDVRLYNQPGKLDEQLIQIQHHL